MTIGKATCRKKIATNAATATAIRNPPRSARPAMRMSAAVMIPTTAAWSPSNTPPTARTSPCAAYVHDSASIRKKAGAMNAMPATSPPFTLCSNHPT